MGEENADYDFRTIAVVDNLVSLGVNLLPWQVDALNRLMLASAEDETLEKEETIQAVRGLTSFGAQAGTIDGRAYVWQDDLISALEDS